VPRTLEVTELRVSGRTANKILTVHGIHEDEVQATVVGQGQLPFRWVEDEERGRRAIVPVAIRDEPAVVVLYPAEGEMGTVWNLGSVYFPEEWENGADERR
jgi:hypothetical protein